MCEEIKMIILRSVLSNSDINVFEFALKLYFEILIASIQEDGKESSEFTKFSLKFSPIIYEFWWWKSNSGSDNEITT